MAQSVIINGSTYSNVPYVEIPKSGGGGDAIFYDCSGDDAVQADVLSGKTFHTSSGSVTGGMTNKGAVTGTISSKTGSYTIPQGYHNGSGTVTIASDKQADIVSSNIKYGANILGIDGDILIQDTTVSSSVAAASGTILNGKKAWVNGYLVEGTYTGVTVTQDQTDNSLTIS